ncbi:MAG: AI-2E family transporter [Bacilli bacterium]
MKKFNDEVDVPKLNEVIKLSRNILNIIFILIVLLLIYIGSSLLKTWNILPAIKSILTIISPLFIGLIIAWLFDPIVSWLNKKGVHRILGTIIVFVLFIGGFILLGTIIIPSLTSQINDIVTSIPIWLSDVKNGIDNIFVHISNASGYDLTSVKIQVLDTLNQIGSSLTTNLPTVSVKFLSSLVNGGMNIVFGFIIGFYMLFNFNNVREHLLTLVPKKYHKDTINLTDRLNKILRSFVHGTLIIAGILFVLQSVGLTIAGMKAPLFFGLFCAITNIIPYLGPWIGGIPVVIIGFSMSPLVGSLCLVSVLVAQSVESYFLQPIVMGKTMKLHPVTIMIGLLIFGHYFGILGMIFATPIISTIKLLFQFFDEKYSFMDKLAGEKTTN